MANIFDKFVNSMKLYDDSDEDYEEDDMDMEEPEPAPRRIFRKKPAEPVEETVQASKRFQTSEAEAEKPSRMNRRVPNMTNNAVPNNVVSMRGRGTMEVCMIKPTSLDDAREVCDILLSGRAVVINMEGVHVDLAQRIIDFTSGSCYSISGHLQKISKYIFIVSPQSIGLTGDFQEVIEGSQDLSNLSLNF